ncbi:RCC1/BLIP-II protein [Cylindrobasidium torrendii FP15055 ss-10]|uniref:RCC1/BLIP-II protein n=1 Tax=Cylindrobasidium torrendii FP15055 ss-10 TaxID=1314674 RepID=A0A0D7BG64_9AGAR|nr:RCC1/BLIP-II protein [Cylindrobasidium torrendii FP15055 ss-10]
MHWQTRLVRAGIRGIHSQALPTRNRAGLSTLGLAGSAFLAGSTLWALHREENIIHSDAAAQLPVQSSISAVSEVRNSDTLQTLVWGSNRSNTLDGSSVEALRTPTIASWLDGVALRDLVVHKDHAACVDANGDVYQWGRGHSNLDKPNLTLRNKNIIQVQATESRLYALSAAGRIYCLEANSVKQERQPGISPPPSSSWLWAEDNKIDFVEVTPATSLGRRESFKSISAGDHHLLAVTSSGRTFAHPIDQYANAYGQLGFRKIRIPQPGSTSTIPAQLVPKTLTEKSVAVAETTENWTKDSIRFCPYIFEIPALVDVPVAQATAGGRSSFALTTSGRILGWGANDYGQIGLGGNVTLDTITVPTEVILKRSVAKCTNVSAGGDLTSFMVRNATDNSVDILMCGNGQWGGLGNNVFSNAQATPTRARGIGALTEYDEGKGKVVPIVPRAISVSATGHVLMTLDTSRGQRVGRDLYTWGKNYDSELGNGRKSSQPMPNPLSVGDDRVILDSQRRARVLDLQGRVWGKNVAVEQTALAGYNNSFVYWKLS